MNRLLAAAVLILVAPLCVEGIWSPMPSETSTPAGAPHATATSLSTDDRSAVAYLIASDMDGDGDIYAVDGLGRLSNLTDNREPDWDPVLSSSGDQVAYVHRQEGRSDIYVLDLTTGASRDVTEGVGFNYEPDWSPDASHLVFVSERDGSRDLYTLDLVHGIRRRVTWAAFGEVYRSPAWSPDGGAIAYSAVRGGIEHIYVLELGGAERQITHWPLKGKYPVWSRDGKWLAFAGWHEEDRPGIYVASMERGGDRWLWEGRAAIRSLTWAGDTILFSMASGRGYDVFGVDVLSGSLSPVFLGPGWHDCPTALADDPLPEVSLAGEVAGWYAKRLPAVLGANVADLGNTHLLRQLGFGWIKNYLSWAGVEPEPGQFDWEDPDNVVTAAEREGVRVLLRLHEAPSWARPAGTSPTHPPIDLGAYGRFVGEVAQRYRGRVAAYEIGNEPNLLYEWGMLDPDPVAYAEMLKMAYEAIKAEDPAAIVVSGGLATTGDGGPGAMGDLRFIEAIYEAGASGYFDALGSHPYGFGQGPFRVHPYGLAVSRVEEQHQVMEAWGDGETPIWATEVGWPVNSPDDMGEHAQHTVSELRQAFYLQQLYLLSAREWPWLEAIFLFNLDFSTVPWYETTQPMRWYAVLEGDGSPRLAFTWLRGVGYTAEAWAGSGTGRGER